eukprot:4926403-Prorocentrum_lima.AAC.1
MLIKWHTGSNEWWHTPGRDKRRILWNQIEQALNTPYCKPVEISLAPVEQDVRTIAKEYWLTPDWEFFDLHEYLVNQLAECRSLQGTNAEMVKAPPP